MGLTIPVILNSVNNLSDARYAAGMGVDWMGFQADEKAERYVHPDLFKAITSWLSGVQTVAEVVILNPAVLAHIKEHYQPDFIQFEHLEDLTEADLQEVRCFQKIVIIEGQELQALQSFHQEASRIIPYIQLDFSGWSAWRSHAEAIKKINSSFVFWALPIEKEDMVLLSDVNIQGLVLKGGDEQRPGWQDLDQMIDILEALEEI